MYKRALVFLLTLMMLNVVPALGEDMSAQPPVLVDRINAPEEHADFAFAEDAPLFEVIFPQILNCDAAFLRCGGETMLVDCATVGQAQRIINMCKQLGITHIDKVINTHPHEDHIGGLKELIKCVTVGELWICFPEDYTTHMTKAIGYANKAGIPICTYKDGDVLTLGDASIEVWMLEGKVTELNDCSAQYFITYGERTFLMAADLENAGQRQFVEIKGELLKADILKYPHHGKEALDKLYMEAVSPLFMVVTNNQTENAGRKFIRNSGVAYAYTVPGFVYLSTDGATWIADRIVSEVKY